MAGNDRTETNPNRMSRPIDKERLRRYSKLRVSIENQTMRLMEMEAALTSSSSGIGDGMPHSSFAVDRMAIQVCRKLELEEIIKSNLLKEKQEAKEIEQAIQLLTEPMEQEVLRLKYLDDMTWPKVAEKLFGKLEDYVDKSESYLRRTHRLHGTALVSIGKATGAITPEENGQQNNKITKQRDVIECHC